MKNNSSVFPEIDVAKIAGINLQRSAPGQRGPGSLVHNRLPPYTDADELVGLCEDTGPGRYKAIALDDRGKPLGPAWAYTVDEPPAPPSSTRLADDEELRNQRAAHQKELNDLRDSLTARFERRIEDEIAAAKRSADAHIQLAELDAERRVEAAERQAAGVANELEAFRRRADEELARAQRRIETLAEDNAAIQRRYAEARERMQEMESAALHQRTQLSERIVQLESDLSSTKRIHEAELRELRNGSPEVHALIAKSTMSWDIEKQRTLLAAELDDRARANSMVTKLSEALLKPEVQEVIFPLVNNLLETLLAPKAPPTRTRKKASAENS